MSDTRVTLVVKNTTGADLVCKDTSCEEFDVLPLAVGTTIPDGGTGTYESSTNDRIFCTWESSVGKGKFEMGMTCPKSSSNSAYGGPNAGLQTYSEGGTPAVFTYVPGGDNLADWGHGGQNEGDTITYGSCS